MKTISFNFSIFFLLLLFNSLIYAQEDNADKPIILKNPIKKTAFHKNIMQDINFMILGDNNTKQGFAYEYDEKKTELTLSGALLSTRYILATIDGSFTVDEGAFIFDNKDGSKKGSINLNFFAPAPIWNGKFYPAANDDTDSAKANRARYLSHLAEEELPKKVADTFNILNKILIDLDLQNSKLEEKRRRIFSREWERQYEQLTFTMFPNKTNAAVIPVEIDQTELLKAILKYYKNPDPNAKYADYKSQLDAIKNGKKKNYIIQGKDNVTVKLEIPIGLDLEKLYKDYDKILTRTENIKEEVNDKQIKIFKDMWTLEYNTYLGLSGYYEREGLDIYNSDPDIQNFDDRFTDTKGDLYGIKASINNVFRWKSGAFTMLRILGDFGRASNFKDFDKKDFLYSSTPIPTDNGSMTEEKKKTGYFTEDGTPYTYGFLQKYSTELYASFRVVGAYAKFGYSKNDSLVKKETLPFETGIMINVNSDKKSVVSILLFVARKDLKVHPDLDTNFGFKIGLPINIKKTDKDKEESKS